MNEELLNSIKAIEQYSCYGNIRQGDNLDSVAYVLATVLRYQQEQITRLQDCVEQLTAINNNATLSDT